MLLSYASVAKLMMQSVLTDSAPSERKQFIQKGTSPFTVSDQEEAYTLQIRSNESLAA